MSPESLRDFLPVRNKARIKTISRWGIF